MSDDIDVELLARFVKVAEAKSLAGASRRTGLPKSTLSRSLARLEALLDVRLVERTTRALRLTDEGLALHERLAHGFQAIEEAVALVGDTREHTSGTLRISVPADLSEPIVAGLVTSFTAAEPGVRVHVEISSRFVDLVAEGFDAAIRAGELSDSSLVAKKLVDARFGLYGSPEYLARNPAPKRVADLPAHAFVLFRPKDGVNELKLPVGGRTNTVVVRGQVAADELGFVRSCCVRGAGLAMLPTHAAAHDVHAGRLVRVLPEVEVGRGGLYFVYPSSRLAPARLKAFRAFTSKYFAALDCG